MTAAKVLRGRALLIKVSDEAGTPVFAHPCLINSARGIEFSSETNSVRIPDCSDPELIAWVKRDKVSLSANISGSGVLHTPDSEVYFNLFSRDTPIAVQVSLSGVAGADGGGYWAGNFQVANFAVTGDLGDYVQCSLTMESDGAITWTDAA